MKKLLVLAGAAALSGCVSILPEPGPAPLVFRIEAPDAPFQQARKADWSIAIGRPSASRTLSGADLVLREDDNRIAFVGGAEWAEPTPDMLQRALAAALTRSGKIVAATTESSARADCELQWDIYSFDARQTADGFSARFEAAARLVGRNRAIQQSTQIAATAEASGGTVRSAAAALTEAALKGMDQAGGWALQQTCEKPAARVRQTVESPLVGNPATAVIPVPKR